MIHQLNMNGKDKVEVAIERLKTFEPPEGYYLAFSGGKDSVVIKALADMAEVKYDAHYNLTSVVPPELVHFIKNIEDVEIEVPRYKDGKQITMWNLIVKKKMPPTRIVRYCCEQLKEHGGENRFKITGVRWAESSRRKNNRGGLELQINSKARDIVDPDNPANETMARFCPTRGSHILNPIIDWTDEDVWEFINEYNVPYCKLYDEGWKRIGCIGCPLSSRQKEELDRFPKYKEAYKRAFGHMLDAFSEESKEKTDWKTADDVYKYFIGK